MSSKNIVLVIVLVVLVSASGLLLYRSFSQRPLTLIPKQISTEDVVIRNQIDTLDVRIKKAVKKVDAGGALDQLISSPQFLELSSEAIKPIIVGETGRDNPFLPVDRAVEE